MAYFGLCNFSKKIPCKHIPIFYETPCIYISNTNITDGQKQFEGLNGHQSPGTPWSCAGAVLETNLSLTTVFQLFFLSTVNHFSEVVHQILVIVQVFTHSEGLIDRTPHYMFLCVRCLAVQTLPTVFTIFWVTLKVHLNSSSHF